MLNSYGLQIDNKSILEAFIRSEISGQLTIHDIKCGTQYDLAVEINKDKLDPKLYEMYAQIKRVDPVRQRSLLSPSGFFELHWDDTGSHAVPQEDLSGNSYPDFIDSAAVILDHVRETQVEQMGYLPPPGEDGNPAIPYHIYFTNQLAYGYTVPVYTIPEHLPRTTYTSYIELDNNFSVYYFPTQGLDGLKVAAAHEFHHAIQFGYNVRGEDIYFFEMTSTWMEEHLYPEINDYLNYLDYFFINVSNSRFDLSGDFPYGNSIYLHMLEAQFEASIMRLIWENITIETSLSAISSSLERNNTTWFESLAEYGRWLYYTGDRTIPDQFFTDALFFPEITIKN